MVLLMAIFGTLEWLWPAKPEQRRLRSGLRVDLIWWVFHPLISRPSIRVVVFLSLIPLFLCLGLPLDRTAVQGHGPLVSLPDGLQLALILIVGDFMSYWLHRLLHTRWFWPIHAIHHSPTELDWMSTLRAHPFNELVSRAPKMVVFVLLGFDLTVVAAYLPLTVVYMLFLHTNMRFRLPGPLKYLIATPHVHRWHHASTHPNCNFAMLPLWDVLFGTCHIPPTDPTAFGTTTPVPKGFLGQLFWPLRPRAYRRHVTLDEPAGDAGHISN